MRVFLALPLSEESKTVLESINKNIKKLYSELKFVNAENMHMTLHFFGELPDHKVEQLKTVLENPLLKIPVIRVEYGSIGFFPSSGKPRVIYINIKEGGDFISQYQNELESILGEAGFKRDEKAFIPHMTLARNKYMYIDRFKLKELAVPDDKYFIDRLTLYESILHKNGPEYIALKTVLFKQDKKRKRI